MLAANKQLFEQIGPKYGGLVVCGGETPCRHRDVEHCPQMKSGWRKPAILVVVLAACVGGICTIVGESINATATFMAALWSKVERNSADDVSRCMDIGKRLDSARALHDTAATLDSLKDVLLTPSYQGCSMLRDVMAARDDILISRTSPAPQLDASSDRPLSVAPSDQAGTTLTVRPLSRSAISSLPSQGQIGYVQVFTSQESEVIPLRDVTTTYLVMSGALRMTVPKGYALVCRTGDSFRLHWRVKPYYWASAVGDQTFIKIVATEIGSHTGDTTCAYGS